MFLNACHFLFIILFCGNITGVQKNKQMNGYFYLMEKEVDCVQYKHGGSQDHFLCPYMYEARAGVKNTDDLKSKSPFGCLS